MKLIFRVLFCIALFLSSPAHANWARVQGNSAAGAAASSTSVAFGSSVTAGDLVVVKFSYYNSVTLSSVSDNASGGTNTYSLAATVNSSSNNLTTAIYYSVIQYGGAFTVKAQFSASAYAPVSIEEYSFASGTLTDTTNTAKNTSNAPASGNVTFTAPRALIVGAIGSAQAQGTATQSGNFNILSSQGYSSGVTYGLYSVDYINATSSPQDPAISFANSVIWTAVGVAFQSSGDSTVVQPDLIWFGSTF